MLCPGEICLLHIAPHEHAFFGEPYKDDLWFTFLVVMIDCSLVIAILSSLLREICFCCGLFATGRADGVARRFVPAYSSRCSKVLG